MTTTKGGEMTDTGTAATFEPLVFTADSDTGTNLGREFREEHAEQPGPTRRGPSWLPRVRPIASLIASIVITIELCLLLWVAVPALALGWTPRVVTSDSMMPALRAGDVVLVADVERQALLPGSIIVFDDPDGNGSIVHRVVEVDERGRYRTKGDSNTSIDPQPLAPSLVRGAGRLLVPIAGMPAVWLERGETITFALWAVINGSLVIMARRPRRPRGAPG